MQKAIRRPAIFALGGAVLVALIGWICGRFPLGNGLARLSYDLPFSVRSRIAAPEICVVVLDEKSARALDQPLDAPWDRRLHSRLLKVLTDEGARAILFDIVFDSASADPAVDEEFAAALTSNGRAFLGAAMRYAPGRSVAEEQILPPTRLLRQSAAGWGLLVFRPIDPDSGVRQIYPGTSQLPAVTWRMARHLGAGLPETPDEQTRWLNYYAPPGTLNSVGYHEALRPMELASDFFRDRIVVIGGHQTLGSLKDKKDQFLTPYTRWGQPFASGVEIHATTLLNLLRHDWLKRLDGRSEGCLIVVFGVLIVVSLYALCAYSPFLAAGVAVAASVLIAGAACFLAWQYHVWFNWLVPVAVQTPVALFCALGTNYALEVRRRAAIRRAFSLYLSPHMADEIANEHFDLTPGGKLVEATMLFTDLRGFTTLSEQIKDPLLIGKVLIEYFNNTTKHVLDNRGTIIKYIGDSVFATWGAPLPDADHPYHAVLAAWGMHQFSRLNVYGHDLVTRIGVNTGTVMAGNLGSDFRFDYACIGDATNLASRLEGLNKYLGTEVLLSETTWQRVSDRFAARPLGKFVLSGKSEPVVLYELLGPSVTNVIQRKIDRFTEGVTAFQSGDLAKARESFERIVFTFGDDGPCAFLLREIARLEETGLPSDWSGAIVMESK